MSSEIPAEPARRIDVADAHRLMLKHMPLWPTRDLAIDEALHAVLRAPVVAERDQPPFDRVTMDGIALRHATLASGRRRFRVIGTQAAGQAAIAVEDDAACVETMTGAVLPPGTDTVIPFERMTRDGPDAVVDEDYRPEAGQCIHRRGSDHVLGQPLLTAGSIIGPPELAILAISGGATVSVGHWPALSVISTGDELVDVGQPITATQIRASNDRAIRGSLLTRGFRDTEVSRLPDDPPVLRERIARLHASSDALILSGGVSMGRFDHVPEVLEELGVRVILHRILQRPGLPMWFGVSATGKPVFALPGNPVSSLVCLVRYVIPALRHAQGARPGVQPRVRLAEEVRFTPDLTLFLPVTLEYDDDGTCLARPRPTNTSGDFVALRGTDGFVELPRGRDGYPAGLAADFWRW